MKRQELASQAAAGTAPTNQLPKQVPLPKGSRTDLPRAEQRVFPGNFLIGLRLPGWPD